ncbi:MAG: energy-coupling factor transporter ATPase [Oscillospiraceae bacterium]|jgi:energy-coupling factor transport system ATP-binding protein|nr:energy-coupling factor transporter ATPase [Oscillospiraceae bacterium]
MPAVQAENISYVYSAGTPFERPALRGVSFACEKGEYVGIIGHTGSGKSTFVQQLNGLLTPSEGRVLVGGVDIRSSKAALREARFRVGLVFQFPEYQLFEETVYRDISFGPRNMGLPADEIDERVREAAVFAGLSEAELGKSPFELSGGQKRRAAIAGVIAMRPEVLILDEPTAGLDPAGRDSLLANIDGYRDRQGAAVIIVTHSMEEAARRADRLVVFMDGLVALEGTPSEVFRHAAALREMGLALPAAAQIAGKLKARGVPLPDGLYTSAALRDALVGLLGGSYAS